MNCELDNPPRRQRLVVFTGAGISVESGLPTFRDNNGLWRNHDATRLASLSGWFENPQLVLDFYNARRRALMEVEPNHAHKMLAELEQWHDVTIITQNVDDLHERAGSTCVIHLHGELTKVTSDIGRDDPRNIRELPLELPICIGDKAADGGQLRPYIVWFGESVTAFELAINEVRQADIFVVIGTSLVVYPAASLVDYVHPEVPSFLIDPGDFSPSAREDLPSNFRHTRATATTGIDQLITQLAQL